MTMMCGEETPISQYAQPKYSNLLNTTKNCIILPYCTAHNRLHSKIIHTMQTILYLKHKLTLAKDRTAIIDGCDTATLDVVEVPTAARAANRDAVERTAEENIVD